MAQMGLVRLGVDATIGHPPPICPPVVAVVASPNVFVDNIASVRTGDAYTPHCLHVGMAVGLANQVYVNNRIVMRISDPLTCGDTQLGGSTDVFAG